MGMFACWLRLLGERPSATKRVHKWWIEESTPRDTSQVAISEDQLAMAVEDEAEQADAAAVLPKYLLHSASSIVTSL